MQDATEVEIYHQQRCLILHTWLGFTAPSNANDALNVQIIEQNVS